jgi:hypothetical protein
MVNFVSGNGNLVTPGIPVYAGAIQTSGDESLLFDLCHMKSAYFVLPRALSGGHAAHFILRHCISEYSVFPYFGGNEQVLGWYGLRGCKWSRRHGELTKPFQTTSCPIKFGFGR